MQWDFQTKGQSGWTGKRSFVLKVPLRYLSPRIGTTEIMEKLRFTVVPNKLVLKLRENSPVASTEVA